MIIERKDKIIFFLISKLIRLTNLYRVHRIHDNMLQDTRYRTGRHIDCDTCRRQRFIIINIHDDNNDNNKNNPNFNNFDATLKSCSLPFVGEIFRKYLEVMFKPALKTWEKHNLKCNKDLIQQKKTSWILCSIKLNCCNFDNMESIM